MTGGSREVTCPRSHHGGSTVVKKGFQTDGAGRLWQRYQCRLAGGGVHAFQVLVDAHGAAVVSITQAPPCPEHAGSAVVRNGNYGTTARRQRYRCRPVGADAHYFTLTLPREHVPQATVKCAGCEEFVGIHKGSQAASRRTRWPLSSVVETLGELAKGVSYAQASCNVWDKTKLAEAHAVTHHDSWTAGPDAITTASRSWPSERGRSAWHVAADIVEQYSPVLYAHVEKGIRAREAKLRATNDRVKAAGQVSAQPITFVLDEIPINVKRAGGKSRVGWSVLAVAEIVWRPGPTPMDQPKRENKLRLVRALPGSATGDTWALVLDELGTTPDVVIADFGGAIAVAVNANYASLGVLQVPSLYHFVRAMALMLNDTVGYYERKNRSRVANPLLVKHLSLVSRDALVYGGRGGWKTWWDDFEQMAADMNAPLAPLQVRRDLFEGPIDAAIPILAAQPFLPGSNAGIEIKNRNLLKPLLRGRQQRYRNIARTNALFDLLVCQENGLFNDTELISHLIREDNLAHGGWSTRLRSFNDIQPPSLASEDDTTKSRYSSLLDTGLVPALLEARRSRTAAVTP